MALCYRNICKNACYLMKTKLQSNNSRFIATTANIKGNSYEGDGKSTVNILNHDESETGILVNGYSQVGFRLSNNMTVLGPMAIFPKSVLSWNVEDHNEINEESLNLFTMLEPKLDLIVIGVGDPHNNNKIQLRLLPFMRKHNLNLEILPTDQACSTFNFLNSEGRYVAGALIPPATIKATDDDVLKSKLRYQKLYETDD